MTHTTSTNNGDAERADFEYRKKPVVIEAVQWNGKKFETSPPDWFCKALYVEPGKPGFVMRWGDDLLIETLEGQMHAAPGDWIIRGVKGELYPCKPDIFAATYEPAARRSPVADAAGELLVLAELNEMRIALTVQIDELIDIASAYEVAMEHTGDFDEARRIRGAVAYARKIAAPYKYNGPLRAQLARQSAPEGAPVGMVDAIEELLREAENENCYGGSEDSDGALHPGYVDWDTLRVKVREVLAAPTSASAQPAEGVEHASHNKENSDE